MSPIQAIQQHVTHFPPDKQAEVLDFVLFLEQKITLSRGGKIQAGATTSVRSVGGSLKEYAQTYVPLRDAREQAIQEYFHERFSRC